MAKTKKTSLEDTSSEMYLASNDGFSSGGSNINAPTIDKIPEENMNDRSLSEGTNNNDNDTIPTNNNQTGSNDSQPVSNPPLRSPTPTNDSNPQDNTAENSTPDEVTNDVSSFSIFNSRILDGANPNDVEAPKEIIKSDDSIWQFAFVWDKTAGATYAPGECCARRIFMPDGWVDEDKIIDDFAPATTEPASEDPTTNP